MSVVYDGEETEHVDLVNVQGSECAYSNLESVENHGYIWKPSGKFSYLLPRYCHDCQDSNWKKRRGLLQLLPLNINITILVLFIANRILYFLVSTAMKELNHSLENLDCKHCS